MSRALAVGLLVAALGLLAAAGYAVASRITGSAARIEERRLLLGRLEAALEALQAPATSNSPLEASAIFMAGPGEAIALASLQSRVSSLAEANGLRLQSSTGLPLLEEGPLRLIGLHIETAGPAEAVLALVHGIEAAEPLQIIDTLHLAPAASGRSGEIDASLDIRAALAPAEGG